MDPPFQVNQYSRKGDKDGLWVDVIRNKRGGLRFQFTWMRYEDDAPVPFNPEDREAMERWEDWYFYTH